MFGANEGKRPLRISIEKDITSLADKFYGDIKSAIDSTERVIILEVCLLHIELSNQQIVHITRQAQTIPQPEKDELISAIAAHKEDIFRVIRKNLGEDAFRTYMCQIAKPEKNQI